MIKSCNKIILNKLVKKINDAECFAVLAYETMDISTKEQFSICVRYIDNEEKKIREDFLQFIEVQDVSGKGLADTILKSFSYFGINPKFLIGQEYDGAVTMSGKFKGVQFRIRELYPLAHYLHSLQFSLSQSSNF